MTRRVRLVLGVASLAIGACASAPPATPCPKVERASTPAIAAVAPPAAFGTRDERRRDALAKLRNGDVEGAEAELGALVAEAPDDALVAALHAAALGALRDRRAIAASGLASLPRVHLSVVDTIVPIPKRSPSPLRIAVTQVLSLGPTPRVRRPRAAAAGAPPMAPSELGGDALEHVFDGMLVYGKQPPSAWVTYDGSRATGLFDPGSTLNVGGLSQHAVRDGRVLGDKLVTLGTGLTDVLVAFDATKGAVAYAVEIGFVPDMMIPFADELLITGIGTRPGTTEVALVDPARGDLLDRVTLDEPRRRPPEVGGEIVEIGGFELRVAPAAP